MELDQFRDVDLVIDYANYSFIEKQFVSQGDYKGRTLTVQVTDNGVVGEVPGLMLHLNWHNEASGLTDLSAFSVLDKANSIYRIEYPQHMMTPGRVIASIQVIQNGKVTNLKQFQLTVQRLAGQAVGIVEKAEFSALVAVLADANRFRTDIDDLDLTKASKEELSESESKLETKIYNTELSLSNLIQNMTTLKAVTFDSLAKINEQYPNGANIIAITKDTQSFYIWDETLKTWYNMGSIAQELVYEMIRNDGTVEIKQGNLVGESGYFQDIQELLSGFYIFQYDSRELINGIANPSYAPIKNMPSNAVNGLYFIEVIQSNIEQRAKYELYSLTSGIKWISSRARITTGLVPWRQYSTFLPSNEYPFLYPLISNSGRALTREYATSDNDLATPVIKDGNVEGDIFHLPTGVYSVYLNEKTVNKPQNANGMAMIQVWTGLYNRKVITLQYHNSGEVFIGTSKGSSNWQTQGTFLRWVNLSGENWKMYLPHLLEFSRRFSVRKKENLFTMLVFTDQHFSFDGDQATSGVGQEHLKNHKKIQSLIHRDCDVLIGDNIDGRQSKEASLNDMRYIINELQTEKPLLPAWGNHDSNGYFAQSFAEVKMQTKDFIDPKEVHDFMFGMFNEKEDQSWYFKDFPDDNIRIIVLNSYDLPLLSDENGTILDTPFLQSAYTADQVKWFAETLKMTPTDYKVIVYAHRAPDGVYADEEIVNGEAVRLLMENFQNGETTHLQTTKEELVSESNQINYMLDETVDFSGNPKGRLLFCAYGHRHADLVTTTNNVIHVTLDCSYAINRDYFTVNDDSFNVVQVDFENEKIIFNRFGKGSNQEFNFISF
ncbi:metallophosphoesterase family protein [Enterococcus casseliflavus]|uniref:metallophosphoesterase family protein n=1 Tax=Enterococcus casseliflavus TaxID=37734 RepID=UPI003D0A0235